MRTLLAGVVLCVLCPAAHAQQTQAEFERLANELPYIMPEQFLHHGRAAAPDDLDGLQPRVPIAASKSYAATLGRLRNGNYPTPDVVKLLQHADPKVRTLAILRLFALEDPKQLPHIATLVDDQAKSFGALHTHITSSITLSDEPPAEMPKLTPITVGRVACLALGVYLDRAAKAGPVAEERLPAPPVPLADVWEVDPTLPRITFLYSSTRASVSPDPAKLRARFDAYWAARKGRAHCVSWYEVRYQRAPHGNKRALRRDIDKLPEPDRTLTLLHLAGSGQGAGLVERAEMLKLCQALGQEKLLAILAGDTLTDDPDLSIAQREPQVYWPMIRYLLHNSVDVFTPAASDKILALERAPFGQKNRSAWWSIAAAELAPKRAADILTPAFQRKYDSEGASHALLAHALYRLAKQPPHDVLREWFHTQGALMPDHQATFLHEAEHQRPKLVRQLAGALVRDKRFDEADWPTVAYLARSANRWSSQDIVGPVELKSLTHPYGQHGFIRDVKVLRERHPDETDAVVKSLADWRRRLRASVPLWEEGK